MIPAVFGKFVLASLMAVALLTAAVPVFAQTSTPRPGSITRAEWRSYVSNFVTASGRVVDTGNGNISHSESQGYGLLLAYLSGDQATFDQIWSFTETNLWLRDDGLVAWKWDPSKKPHIQDINNASDGDVLIAYSLALASKTWNRPDFKKAAKRISEAVAAKLVFSRDGTWLLWPAVSGFGAEDRKDAPVINLSYWIFEAFPVLAEMTGQDHWGELSKSGVQLVRDARFGPDLLPSDWISLKAGIAPAAGFPAEFSFNAFRIPLYLLRAGHEAPDLLLPFLKVMNVPGGGVDVIDVSSGKVTDRVTEPGYASIGAALACVLNGTPLPDDLKVFEPTSYYASTLHLLVLSFLSDEYPECT